MSNGQLPLMPKTSGALAVVDRMVLVEELPKRPPPVVYQQKGPASNTKGGLTERARSKLFLASSICPIRNAETPS